MLGDPQTSFGPEITSVMLESDRTTPSQVQINVGDLVDYVAVQVFVTHESGRIVTGCHTASAWRIGPNAADWPKGTPIALPLGYTENLSPGRYVEHVSLHTHSHRAAVLQTEGFDAARRRFEVSSAGIAPITDYIPSGVSSPCPAFPIVADEMPLEQATTIVNADEWHNAGSIQPIRWDSPPPAVASAPDAASVFTYDTFTRTGNKLSFLARVEPSPEPPTDVTLTMPGAARLKVSIDPMAISDLWTSIAGEARITEDATGRWSITLSNVELANDLSGEVDRTIPSGSITGRLMQ